MNIASNELRQDICHRSQKSIRLRASSGRLGFSGVGPDQDANSTAMSL
jgi:hypothetical protein